MYFITVNLTLVIILFIGNNHLCGEPFLFPPEVQPTVSSSRLGQSVQEYNTTNNRDPEKQSLVVSVKTDPVIQSIKRIIQEKTEEIEQLKRKIGELQDQLCTAESKKEQYKAQLAVKEQEIKSLKERYDAELADANAKLEEAKAQTEKLEHSNRNLEKRLKDQQKRIKDEYEEKIKELENEKVVECLKLKLKHVEETKDLELKVKDLQRQLEEKKAEVERKKALIAEMRQEQMEEQIKDQQNTICNLREQNQRLQQHLVASASPITSDEPKNASSQAPTLQSITDKAAGLSLNPLVTHPHTASCVLESTEAKGDKFFPA